MLSFFAYYIYASGVTVVDCVLIEHVRAALGFVVPAVDRHDITAVLVSST